MNDVSQRPFERVPVLDLAIVFERLGTHSVFRFHKLWGLCLSSAIRPRP